MARKGNLGTKTPSEYKPFYVPPDIKVLGAAGTPIIHEMRREYTSKRASWDAKKRKQRQSAA